MAALVETALQMRQHVLGDFAEERAENPSQQQTGQVEPLLAEVVAVDLVGGAKTTHEQLVHSVAKKDALLGLAVLLRAHVQEDLLLKNDGGVANAVVARDVSGAAESPNKVFCG